MAKDKCFLSIEFLENPFHQSFSEKREKDFVLYKGKEYIIFVQYNHSTINEPFKS